MTSLYPGMIHRGVRSYYNGNEAASVIIMRLGMQCMRTSWAGVASISSSSLSCRQVAGDDSNAAAAAAAAAAERPSQCRQRVASGVQL